MKLRALRLFISFAICSLCLNLNAQTDPVYDGFVHHFWTGNGNHVRCGLLDTAGNIICRPSFAKFGAPFFDSELGPLPATKGRKWGYINTKGEWVVRPQFEYAGNFHNGLAKVVVKGKTGYIRSDLVDSIAYANISGKTTAKVNYRTGPSSSPRTQPSSTISSSPSVS